MAGDQPIVVTGGSVTIDFNDGVYTRGNGGRHSNASKKIHSVEVVDDTGKTIFSKDFPNGKVTVRIHTRD